MSEIKFKVWDKDKKKFLFNGKAISLYDLWHDGLSADYAKNELSDFEKDWKRYKFLLYIGYKDKNATEIYDGDIIKVNIIRYDGYKFHTVKEVKWDVTETCFDDNTYVQMHAGFSLDISDDEYNLEIVGNIYENPELSNEKPI